MPTMRDRFSAVMARSLDDEPRLALILADIGVSQFAGSEVLERHPERIVNVGIREQLLVSVAGGMALEGMRPVIHTYAPFLVERAFEQIKLDLGHQDVGAVLVAVGASYEAASEARTDQAPGDVALLSTLPGWTIHVPGHPDEVETLLLRAFGTDERVYIRLSAETNTASYGDGGFQLLRAAGPAAPLVVAVGPTLDPVLAAVADLDISVAFTATVRPFDGASLREALRGNELILVEPTLAGTSAGEVSRAVEHIPHRLLSLGVQSAELRRYGTGADHRRAHGLDANGIRRSLDEFLARAL